MKLQQKSLLSKVVIKPVQFIWLLTITVLMLPLIVAIYGLDGAEQLQQKMSSKRKYIKQLREQKYQRTLLL